MSAVRRATHWVMNLFGWLRPQPTPPILLRLSLGEACPSAVEVEAEWLPSRRRVRERYISTASMVLVPWRRDAEGAVLRIHAAGHVGEAEVTAESNRSGTVVDLPMRRVG